MASRIHIFFLPFLAHGHLIPTLDMAKLFASRGVKATIITTPLNASSFSDTIDRIKESGIHIGVEILNFPAVDVGLPDGCESLDLILNSQDRYLEMVTKFHQAVRMLQEPIEMLLQKRKPDCLVADMFLPWATDAANKFGIPRLVFHGTCYFSLCAIECIRLYKPHDKVQSDTEPFVVPNLPGDIKLIKNQLPDFMRQDVGADITKAEEAILEAELKSYGVIVNSFYELEATYADYYRNALGKKAWQVGPVSLCNRAKIDKAERGKKSSIDNDHEFLKWLDSKEPHSVVYICFGSSVNFTSAQLKEIAMALETSELEFIWVVREQNKNEEEEDRYLPEGFEKRMKGKGVVIRGWAPQVLILGHEAIGGFVTHCGWNSTLESVCAGVPMVTWPVGAEQFYNEKLVTKVLKIGVGVGAQKWGRFVGDFVKREAIEKAVKEIMEGDKAVEMRSRAEALAQAAKIAIEKGGSSHSDLDALLEQLISTRCD